MTGATTQLRIPDVVLVALGGALGAVLRWLLTTWIGNGTPQGQLPTGTLVVNLAGCMIAGLLLGCMERLGASSESLRAFAMVGILGAFTTLSAFSVETMDLLRRGATGVACTYVAASVAGGIGLAMLAFWLVAPAVRPGQS